MPLTVGIAVPCYVNHVKYIDEFLKSYENGSVKPDNVVISISSMPPINIIEDYSKKYTFPIDIRTFPTKKVAGENRNIAKSHLKTDIISFMDVDDVATFQRVEFIKRAFEENPEIGAIVHNYVAREYFDSEESQIIDEDYKFYKDAVYLIPGNMCLQVNKEIVKNDSPYNDISYYGAVMHSQLSVRREIINSFLFDTYDRGEIEDVVMIRKLWDAGVKFGYLNCLLSKYRPKSF